MCIYVHCFWRAQQINSGKMQSFASPNFQWSGFHATNFHWPSVPFPVAVQGVKTAVQVSSISTTSPVSNSFGGESPMNNRRRSSVPKKTGEIKNCQSILQLPIKNRSYCQLNSWRRWGCVITKKLWFLVMFLHFMEVRGSFAQDMAALNSNTSYASAQVDKHKDQGTQFHVSDFWQPTTKQGPSKQVSRSWIRFSCSLSWRACASTLLAKSTLEALKGYDCGSVLDRLVGFVFSTSSHSIGFMDAQAMFLCVFAILLGQSVGSVGLLDIY